MPPIPIDVSIITSKPVWQGTFAPANVDLIAMLVSDSGLASIDPQWWNGSVKACILIGLQPRGGWQLMQRTVQWGDDRITRLFGVTCPMPSAYAYFTCSIRNRLEMWDSSAWISPTEGGTEPADWQSTGRSYVDRPGKLIDGSRGGQAFICDLLRPADGKSYSIVEQSRMQFLSLLLVAAGLIKDERLKDFDALIQEDFQLSERLGIVFRPLFRWLVIANVLVMVLAIACFYSIFRTNLFGAAAPYVIQSSSLLLWATAATALLMLGGNPRVRIVQHTMPDLLRGRLKKKLEEWADADSDSESKDDQMFIKVSFGSIHGSVFTEGQGSCSVPFELAQRICCCDIELIRTRSWKIGVVGWGFCLLLAIGMQALSAQVANIYSTIYAVAVLLLAALARGYGIAGPEAWLIPSWKTRKNAAYGARLVGRMEARTQAK